MIEIVVRTGSELLTARFALMRIAVGVIRVYSEIYRADPPELLSVLQDPPSCCCCVVVISGMSCCTRGIRVSSFLTLYASVSTPHRFRVFSLRKEISVRSANVTRMTHPG